MKQYTHGELTRIVKLRMAGWHPRDISAIVERGEPAINRILSIEKARCGYRYPSISKASRWTQEAIETMARDYPAKTYKQMALEHNVSTPRIYHLMAKRAFALQMGEWNV